MYVILFSIMDFVYMGYYFNCMLYYVGFFFFVEFVEEIDDRFDGEYQFYEYYNIGDDSYEMQYFFVIF